MGLLFERYHRKLYSFLYHMLGRADTSEDLVQTVFYRMLKYRHTYTGEGSFGPGCTTWPATCWPTTSRRTATASTTPTCRTLPRK
ncbi:RNA polymerase sigma factor [Hymenobacter cellulosilyticus]|uniref:RNA polymerase sigma factor n=1 Tax=Hymenobacter cellulosilyticus TaxID=2932248 RepID=UPI0028802394|nr:sigma factor [Hymenobacter cellulosilyticus]